MNLSPGDTVIIDLPGSALHGKAVEVLEDVPEFNLAPEGAEPFLAHMVRVRTPYGEFVYHMAHISGTAEASERRRWEADLRRAEIEAKQGELLL